MCACACHMTFVLMVCVFLFCLKRSKGTFVCISALFCAAVWMYDTEGSGIEPVGLVAEIWLGCEVVFKFPKLSVLTWPERRCHGETWNPPPVHTNIFIMTQWRWRGVAQTSYLTLNAIFVCGRGEFKSRDFGRLWKLSSNTLNTNTFNIFFWGCLFSIEITKIWP